LPGKGTFLSDEYHGVRMSVNIRAPNERRCVRCGRRESWSESASAWRVPNDDVGEVACIHDWDVTGEFRPVER